MSSELVFICPLFHVLQHTKPRVHYTLDVGDWAVIMARTSDGKFILASQVRAGTGEVYIEAPGGKVEPGEDPRATVERELLEETGYKCRSIHSLGYVFPNPALQNNRFHMFFGSGAWLENNKQRTEDIGIVDVKIVSKIELRKIVTMPGMHALSLHAMLRALDYERYIIY